jgi:hypothetical protein
MYRKHIIILQLMSLFSIIGIMFAFLSASILRNTALAATQTATCGKWNNILGANTSSNWNTLNSVSAIASSDIWAVGYSSTDGANYRTTLTEHWNGTQWSIVTSPNITSGDNTLLGVATISTKDVWAVGYSFNYATYQTIIMHWNGFQWKVVSSPNPSTASNILYAVTAISTNNVWAVGDYSSPSTGNNTLVEHWNGSQWSVVPSPNSAIGNDMPNGITALSATNIWAAGSSNIYNQTLIEHWDGIQWSIVPSLNKGLGNNVLNGIASDPATGEVWSVGSYQSNGENRTLIEYWSGTKWKIMYSPNIGPQGNFLNSVTATSANNVWAVGYFINFKTAGRISLIEHWNGSKWVITPGTNPGTTSGGNFLNSVISVPQVNQYWAVGYYIATPPIALALTSYYC